jgi:prepilin-type N-terminal cleavage/methylation domain-containing protein
MLNVARSIHALRSEHGFTLIELLVAMVTGLVVTTAAFALLYVAGEQSSRATDFVQASQTGRTAMAHIVDELNSACVGEKAAPILEGSTREKLIFVTGFSEKTLVEPSEVQKHVIYWKQSKGEVGKLYDEEAIATKETSAGSLKWEFAKLAEPGYLIDADVIRPKNAKGEFELFTYDEFAKEVAKESSTTPLSGLTPVVFEKELSSAEAKDVASVAIQFRSLPVDESTKVGRDFETTSQVSFAFSAPLTEPSITTKGGCQ